MIDAVIVHEPWRELARCDGLPPQLFDDDGHPVAPWAPARTICASCPVRPQCLEDALEDEGRTRADYRGGIRGALTPGERVALQLFRDTAAKLAGTFERPARPRRADRPPARCRRCGDFARSASASYCEPCRLAVGRESTAARRAAAREAS